MNYDMICPVCKKPGFSSAHVWGNNGKLKCSECGDWAPLEQWATFVDGLSFKRLLNDAMLIEGINQLELANRTGLTIGAISMLCAGQRQPRFETVRRIKKALKSPADYWL